MGARAIDRIRRFIASESVLAIAAVVAIASMAGNPLTPATAPIYAGFIDMHTLALLTSLMVVVGGLERAGLIESIRSRLMGRMGSTRSLALVLVNVVFFSSMFITNDVALLAFVPLGLAMFLEAGPRSSIALVVALTVAANLGSAAMPIGNPQNIYLVSAYGIGLGEFFRTMAPLAAVSYACSCALALLVPREDISHDRVDPDGELDMKRAAAFAALFALCLLCVAGALSWQACLICVLAGTVLVDCAALRSIDFGLLATFVCFFVFVGNLKQSDAVSALLTSVLSGRELIVSALASQVVSNVPAAIMLSGFTDQGSALLLGTNIGGLGTPIASLASLISLRIYARMPHARVTRYLALFSIVNFALLALLLMGTSLAL